MQQKQSKLRSGLWPVLLNACIRLAHETSICHTKFQNISKWNFSLGPCSQILVLTHDMPKTKGYAVKVTEWQYNLCWVHVHLKPTITL